MSNHIEPRWEHVPLAEVWHADVVAWISSIDLAPASVHYIHRVFSLILELAVQDNRLARNLANGVRLPKVGKPKKRYLTKAELFRLAGCAGGYRSLIFDVGL